MGELQRGFRSLPLSDRLAIALGLAVVVLLAASSDEGATGVEPRGFDLGAAAMLAVGIGLLLFSRRAPAVVAIAVLGLPIAWYQAGYQSGAINVVVLAAFYQLGASGDRRRQLGIGAAAVAIVLVAMIGFADESLGSAAGAVGWMAAALVVGELVSNRRLLLAEYRARAHRAEADRDAEAERRVQEARMEIARDLHDVLAHTVSAMTVQAGVAADCLDRDPVAARAALQQVRSAGREAIGEVQALVRVLRAEGATAGLAPAPGLAHLEELADVSRAAGVEVVTMVNVEPAAVTDAVAVTVHRIVQESLTNVRRHASASRAWIEVAGDDQGVDVAITDNGDGHGEGGSATGFGLRGMRERVEALGGRFSAGPRPEGGWQVRARLPAHGLRPS